MAAGTVKPMVPWDLDFAIRRGTITQYEKAGQSFKKGSPLKVTAGQVEVCAAGFASGLRFIAAEDASGVTDAPIEVWPVTVGQLWEITSTDAFAVAHRNTAMGLVEQANGYWALDNDDVNDQFILVKELEPWVVGDTNLRVIGRFTAAALV